MNTIKPDNLIFPKSAHKSGDMIMRDLKIEDIGLDFSNLNDCVTALIKKTKEDDYGGREIKRR